ncbi:MAG: thiamine-phosphate kinase [Proteobacteria bacterium]|nr:thiamine-phosphate kinase [Pseudomonadota bacterium]
MPSEFDLIGRHFRPLAGPGALDLEDDAAIVVPPPGRVLVMAADAMVAGVHYLPDDPADGVARKLLRVNLSDLAAMGAAPLGYLLTVSAPTDTPDGWFAAFAAGLAADQAEFGVTLLGGDTTSTPGPVTLSLTIIGHVAPGAAIRRRGAKPGDEVWVTGTIGDGALGLAVSLGRLEDATGYLRGRYRVPTPRLGLPLAGVVSAAIDVSDGLLQDLGHLCRLAGCGAEIEAGLVPLSESARAAGPGLLADILGGGDDYELLLAVPEGRGAALAADCAALGVPLTRIGRFTGGGAGVRVVDAAHETLTIARHGWSHF